MKLTSKASIQIQKPTGGVFEGIVDPEKMTKYFISESTGRLATGNEVLWKFPEFPDKFAIKNIKTEPPTLISFEWDDNLVRINLKEQEDKSTLVKITEGEKPVTEENLKWVLQNTEGWANFLACLKAYLEYGIELRKGAFDFMKSN